MSWLVRAQDHFGIRALGNRSLLGDCPSLALDQHALVN
jgi:hypothetical protein